MQKSSIQIKAMEWELFFREVSPPFLGVLQGWLFAAMVETSAFQGG